MWTSRYAYWSRAYLGQVYGPIHGKDQKIVKGNTLTVMLELPYCGLSQFGARFLNHSNGSVADSPLLKFMNIIDSPGILSGQKQLTSPEYPCSKTAKRFVDRSDLILLLYDAHKLDISDEFKEVVESIRPHIDDKIRCVLNKADSVEKDHFVRVYGSLMWAKGASCSVLRKWSESTQDPFGIRIWCIQTRSGYWMSSCIYPVSEQNER